jgi:exonuclease III
MYGGDIDSGGLMVDKLKILTLNVNHMPNGKCTCSPKKAWCRKCLAEWIKARQQPLSKFILGETPDVFVLTEFAFFNNGNNGNKAATPEEIVACCCERAMGADIANIYSFWHSYEPKPGKYRNAYTSVLVGAKKELRADAGSPPPQTLNLKNRWVEITVNEITLLGVYLPACENKRKPFWDTLLDSDSFAQTHIARPELITGDFNECLKRDSSNEEHTKAVKKLEKLLQMGWVDAWRLHNPDETEFTWRYSKSSLKRRIDYLFLSPDMARAYRVTNARHVLHTSLSDHAALVVELQARTN